MNLLSYAEGVSLFKHLSDTFTDTIAKAMEIEMLESIQSLLQHCLDDVVKFMKSSFVKTKGVCEQVMTEFKTATEDSTLATLQPLIQCDEFPSNKAEFLALLQHNGAVAMFSTWRSVSTFRSSWKDIAHGVVCVSVFMFRLQSSVFCAYLKTSGRARGGEECSGHHGEVCWLLGQLGAYKSDVRDVKFVRQAPRQ